VSIEIAIEIPPVIKADKNMWDDGQHKA